MSEYVPTTEEVRDGWMTSGPPSSTVVRALEFERWLEQVRAAARREGQAEAFDEGWKARAERDPLVMNVRGHSAPPPPHGLNPYRQEAGQ